MRASLLPRTEVVGNGKDERSSSATHDDPQHNIIEDDVVQQQSELGTGSEVLVGEEGIKDDTHDDTMLLVKLPVLEYGYRTEPMEWPELCDIILRQQELSKLTRNVGQQRHYELFKRNLQLHWNSLCDYILCDKFGFDSLSDATTGLLRAHPSLAEINPRPPRTVVVKNDFPYCTIPAIEHWVLWKLGGVDGIADDDLESAKQHLCETLGNVRETLHWITPVHLKTVPEIDHAHILCWRGT